MFKATGITARTTLLAWTVTLVTLGIFVVILIPEQKRDLQDALESKAQLVAATVQSEIAGAHGTEGYLALVDHAQQVMSGDPAVKFLAFTKKDDGFSVFVDRNSWRVVPTIDDYWHPSDSRPTGYIEQIPLFKQRDYHFAGPLDYGGRQWGSIHVGLSLDSYDASVRHISRRTAGMAVICILLGLIPSLLYARHFVGPILQLREVVEKVAGGDYTARARIKSDDEIRQLANAFNNMADAIVQRNRILESVRFTAQSLQSTHEWGSVIDPVLAKIGLAANASRVLVGEKHASPDGAALGSIRFEWTAAAIEPWMQTWQNRGLEETGLESLASRLEEGEMIVARRDEMKAWPEPQPEAPPLSQIIAPILIGDVLWGILVVQDCTRDRDWGKAEQDSIRAVAEMLSASILRQNAQHDLVEAKSDLERRVVERTRELVEQIVAKDQAHAELEEAQKRLIELSRISGMAEVATAVLHNVGNVLNSINVSATIIADRLNASRVSQLSELARLLKENQSNLSEYLADDPKGQRILPYLDKLSRHLLEERDELSQELNGLAKHVGHVKDIVALQQTHAKTAGVLETIAFHSLIEDALRMTIAEMDRHGVQVTKEIEAVPLMSTDRHKVLQILLNLMRNAKDAVKASGTLPRKITVRACSVGTERVRFQLVDNGVGIPKENLARVFSHGFTTKRDGHGFGLHFGALTASQLGGSLSVESAGLGCGATFTLELPLQAKNDFNPRSTQ